MPDGFAELKGFVKGFFWGVILAIAALIFLETEQGQKLKKRLKEKGGDLFDQLPDLLDRLEKRSEELVEEAGKIEGELKEKTASIGESLTKEVERELDSSLAHIEALQEHGREITVGIKRHLFKNIPRKSRPIPN